MTDRILPEYKNVLGQEMEEAIYRALGVASTCWEPMIGDSVFDSERAHQVGKELMEIVVKYAQEYPCPHTTAGRRMRGIQ